jgi:hypothetical protein
MKDITTTHGRTVLFVSHNLESVQRLCSRCLLLDRGRVRTSGPTSEVIAEYLSDGTPYAAAGSWTDLSGAVREGTGEARIKEVLFTSGNAQAAGQPYMNGPLEIALAIDARELMRVQSIAIGLRDNLGRKLVNADTGSFGQTITLPEGRTVVRLQIERLHLKPGVYGLALWIARYPGERISSSDVVDFVEKAIEIEIIELASRGFGTWVGDTGVVSCDFKILDITHPQALRDTLSTANS